MSKPIVTSMYRVIHALEEESKIQIVSLKGGKSYQTITFPKGTIIEIFMSKLPVEEELKD